VAFCAMGRVWKETGKRKKSDAFILVIPKIFCL